MISSIFGNTKPINLVFLGVFLVFYYALVHVFILQTPFEVACVLSAAFFLGLLIATGFLVEFISKRNNLSRNNSFIPFFFVLVLCLYPLIFAGKGVIVANLLVLLAIRRLLNLQNNHNIKQKLFDATLLIAVAMLFYEWAVLYLLLVYAAIVIFTPNDHRNWLVPPVGVGAIAILVSTYYVFAENMDSFYEIFRFKVVFNFQKYKSAAYLLPSVFTLIIAGVSLFFYIVNLKSRPIQKQGGAVFIIATLATAVFVTFLSDDINAAELIFLAFPMAVVITYYVERLDNKWLKEGILWMFLLLPLLLLVL